MRCQENVSRSKGPIEGHVSVKSPRKVHRRMAKGVVSGDTQRIATWAWFQGIPEPTLDTAQRIIERTN